jgi:hypothetical protein
MCRSGFHSVRLGVSSIVAVVVVVTVVAMGYATSAIANTVFFESWDGGDLPLLPDVSFDAPWTLGPGNTLLIDSTGGPNSRNRLFTWYLIPGFEPEGLIVDVTIDYTPVGGGANDPIFGFTDGTNFLGWQRSDDSNGSWQPVQGTFGLTAPAPGAPLLSNVGPVGLMFSTFSFLDEQTGASAEACENSMCTGSHQFLAQFAIDTDRPLTFVWYGQSGGETYQINSIQIAGVPSGVSVPSVPTGSTWMLVGTLVAVAYRARHAHAARTPRRVHPAETVTNASISA